MARAGGGGLGFRVRVAVSLVIAAALLVGAWHGAALPLLWKLQGSGGVPLTPAHTHAAQRPPPPPVVQTHTVHTMDDSSIPTLSKEALVARLRAIGLPTESPTGGTLTKRFLAARLAAAAPDNPCRVTPEVGLGFRAKVRVRV